LVCGAQGKIEEEERLGINTSLELYLLVVMICICAVALWECGKKCVRKGEEARMAAVKAKERILSKNELRELQELLGREPEEMSHEEHDRFVLLAALAGLEPEVEVPAPKPKRKPKAKAKPRVAPTEPVQQAAASSSAAAPSTAPFCAGIPPGGEEVSAEVRAKVLKDVGTQVVLDAAPCPDEVWLTPNGNCVHPKKTCPTLAVSSRRERRTVCQVCWPGKPMISLEEWNRRKGR
jgi:hypothetical protein